MWIPSDPPVEALRILLAEVKVSSEAVSTDGDQSARRLLTTSEGRLVW